MPDAAPDRDLSAPADFAAAVRLALKLVPKRLLNRIRRLDTDTVMRNYLYAMGLLSFLFGGCGKQPTPADKTTTQTMPSGEISYSQSDITERFDDHLHLKPEYWIATVPLNKSVPNGKGLPTADASTDEVYKAAAKLSQLREFIPIPSDGVYCPVCHIANTQLAKLRTPCPKCSRPLLKFGWD